MFFKLRAFTVKFGYQVFHGDLFTAYGLFSPFMTFAGHAELAGYQKGIVLPGMLRVSYMFLETSGDVKLNARRSNCSIARANL